MSSLYGRGEGGGGASHLEDPDRHVAAEPRLPLQEERARLFHAQRVRPPVVEAEAAEVLPGRRTSQRGAAALPVRAGTRAGKRQTLSILPKGVLGGIFMRTDTLE